MVERKRWDQRRQTRKAAIATKAGLASHYVRCWTVHWLMTATDSPHLLLLLFVIIEPLAALLTEPASVHHSLQKHARPVLGIAGALIQNLLD